MKIISQHGHSYDFVINCKITSLDFPPCEAFDEYEIDMDIL